MASAFSYRFGIKSGFACILALGALTACTPSATIRPTTDTATVSKDGTKAAPPAQAFARFPDMPVPAGAKIDLDRTVVFGSDESWFGQIALSVGFGADRMFDFYKQELAGFGWQEITSVRSATSVLTYSRDDRIATLQIAGATLQGTNVLITVSPKGAPVQSPGTPPIAK